MKERPRPSFAGAPVPSGTRRSARIAKRQLTHPKAPSSPPSAPAFEWTPLDKARKEIRILELAQGAGSEPLSGQLYHAFLDLPEKPYYEAISYVWGGPECDMSIVVNNALAAIPASADSALRCMRFPNKSRRLWIDCVCIDQNNELEKGHQVGIMSEIFTFSQGTLAHLGDGDDFAQSAVKVFEILQQWGLEEDETGELGDCHKGPGPLGLAWNDIAWHSINKYLDLPYFRRLWIVQEAALAVRTKFHCGSTQLDFGAFSLALSALMLSLNTYLLHNVVKAGQSEVDPITFPLCFELARSVFKMSRSLTLVTWARKQQKEQTIARVIHTSKGLESTDPRDRIFGLLGLLKRLNPAEQLPLGLTPDYNKPLAHVYRDATRAAIRQQHDLSMLLHDFQPLPKDGVEDLPSWVPPWYSAKTKAFWVADFNAAKRFPLHFCDSDIDPNILTLASFAIGEVKAYCQPVRVDYDSNIILSFNVKDYEAYFSVAEALTRQWAPSGEPMHDRLVRTLMGGYTASDGKLKRANADSIASFTAENWRVPGQQAHSSEESPSRNEPSSISNSFALGLLFNNKRRFYVTDSGHIGLGSRALEEGDVVAVLGGGKCPFVLRPASERGCGFYTMVGPAYVDGIMDGEAVQEHMEQGREIKTIHLI